MCFSCHWFTCKTVSLVDKPGRPNGPIEFSDLTEDSVTLTWKPPTSDGGTPITSYTVEYRDTRKTTWMRAGVVLGNKTFTLRTDKLIEGNEYVFRVIAVNAEGDSKPLDGSDPVTPMKKTGGTHFYLLKQK